MSPQDSLLLQDFLNQLVQASGVPKDPEAEAMIARAVAQQPDAAYLLVQRALLQQQALNNAQAEIAALQQQLRGGQRGGASFLDPNAWGHGGASRPAAAGQAGTPQPYPPQQYHAQQYPQQQYPYYQQPPMPRGGFLGGRMGGMGSTLGTIASTAAGVAAGAFLFQGLGNLLGGGNHDGNGFLGDSNAFSSLTAPLDHLTGDNASADNFADGSPGAGDATQNFAGNDAGNSLLDDAGGDNFGNDSFDGGGSDDGMFG